MHLICVQIGANGVLSFRSQLSSLNPRHSYPPLLRPQLAINRVLIAPFWTYINNNAILARQIFYRYSDNQTLLDEVGFLINDAFDNNFSPSILFVATWDRQRRHTNSQRVMT
jgi:tryptophan-rich sensory protein